MLNIALPLGASSYHAIVLSSPDDAIRILVVDDETDVLEMLAEYLRVRGCVVRTCSSLADGHDSLASEAHDVLLTDLHLGGASGLELVRAAATHPSGVAVAVMTGFPRVSSAVEASQQGAYAYVCKPFRLSNVYEILVDAHAATRQRRSEQVRLARLERIEAAFAEGGLEAVAPLLSSNGAPIGEIVRVASDAERAEHS